MSKTIPTVILEYDKACEDVTREFLEHYFADEPYDVECWAAGDIGGVYNVGDYFFDFHRMEDALRYGATKDQLFDYYDLEIEAGSFGTRPRISFKNFILTPSPKETE